MVRTKSSVSNDRGMKKKPNINEKIGVNKHNSYSYIPIGVNKHNSYANIPTAPRKQCQHYRSHNYLTHLCKITVSDSSYTSCKNLPADCECCDNTIT